jgi:hypothetical protein
MSPRFTYKAWTLVIGIFVALIIGFALYSDARDETATAKVLVPQVSITDLKHLLLRSAYVLR